MGRVCVVTRRSCDPYAVHQGPQISLKGMRFLLRVGYSALNVRAKDLMCFALFTGSSIVALVHA